MTLQMLVHFRLALQNVQRHLLELRNALFGKQHLDGAHVRGAVEAPENHFRHEFLTSVLELPSLVSGHHGLYLASQSVVSLKTSRCCSDSTGKCGEPG